MMRRNVVSLVVGNGLEILRSGKKWGRSLKYQGLHHIHCVDAVCFSMQTGRLVGR